MRKIIIAILILFVTSDSICQTYDSVSFYVVAHPDQWQLFMGLNAYNDIIAGPSSKVVFIYTTAGDSSCGGAELNIPFYQARKEGANNTVEFCADQWGSHDILKDSIIMINGHSVLKYTYKNVISYCLLLPEGCYGVGLFGQSIQYLHDHPSTYINSVDNSTAYISWADLMLTVQNIFLGESNGIPVVSLNMADTDQTINPGDHPDHVYTGILGLEAAAPLLHVNEALFEEYNITTLPVNLSNADIATKSALLSILDYARTVNLQSSEWRQFELNFTGRNYYRTITR